jgi:hypothetical protein
MKKSRNFSAFGGGTPCKKFKFLIQLLALGIIFRSEVLLKHHYKGKPPPAPALVFDDQKQQPSGDSFQYVHKRMSKIQGEPKKYPYFCVFLVKIFQKFFSKNHLYNLFQR